MLFFQNKASKLLSLVEWICWS